MPWFKEQLTESEYRKEKIICSGLQGDRTTYLAAALTGIIERQRASAHWFIPQMPAMALAGVKARSWKPCSGFPHGWQRASQLSHHLMPARVCISRGLESAA